MTLCTQCGQENPDGFRFCGRCGAALDSAPASEERKVVTVLFADLVGFTSRSERMDVEDVRGTLAPYHALLRNELEHHGGTVEKFIGDAVMALFGAPVAHEDDPERAVRAALSIRAAIERLNDEQPGLDLHVRIGIDTGEAFVVLGADVARGEGMASGDVVNTAARLQTAAPIDGILVGETTFHATDRPITYRSVDPVSAKGKADPVPVWEAIEARSRFGVDVVQRPTTPLVGRSEELDLLLDALRRCRSERAAQLVTLVGVPGIGKSRLVWELFEAVEADPDYIIWRQGRSLPYGDGVTFWALGEMIKAQAGILDSDTTSEADDKLRASVGELIADPAEARWVEGHVRALVGIESEDTGAGSDRGSEATTAWRRLLEALADRNPLVLVFEDMHWADDALLDFVDHLVDWVAGVPMLVICTTRPELLDRRRGWGGGKRNVLTVALSPLSDVDVAHLIGGLLEQAVLPAETQQTLLTTAAGNPLYAEEYVRMLIDRGYLHRAGAGWQITVDGDLPVPESVQGLIAARLDDLPADEKRLLQDAAVLGKVVWQGALAAMGEVTGYSLEAPLHALERREMLRRERRSSVGADTEYAFRHVLMRDVAYGQIPRAQRADKHRRAAEWIESASADRENAPELLAHHYSSALGYARDAGQPTEKLERRTRVALRAAAERASALSSLSQAERLFQEALALWPESDSEWPYLVVAAAGSGDSSQRTDEMVEALGRARDRLIETGDLASAAKSEMLVGFRYWNEGRGDEAAASIARSSGLLEHAEPSPAMAYVLSRLAISYMLRDEFEVTIELSRRAGEMAEQFDLDEIRAHALNTSGTARVGQGDLSGVAEIERSVEIAERLNSLELTLRGYKNLGSVLYELGEPARAIALGRRGLELATRFGAEYQMRWYETELAVEDFAEGEWDRAEQVFAHLDAWIAASGPHYIESVAHMCRALLRASRGDRAGAVADADGALAFARGSLDRQVVLPTLADSVLVAAILDRDDLGHTVDDLMAELSPQIGDRAEVGYWPCALALGLALANCIDLFPRGRVTGPSRWLKVAELICDSKFSGAADELTAMGALSDAAIARLVSARALRAQGRSSEADAELAPALQLWHRVGATQMLALADAAHPKSALGE